MVKLTLENLASKIGKRIDLATTTELNLANKQIEEVGSFAKMENLEKVDFSGNWIRNQRDIEKLFDAPKLRDLNFSGNQLTKTSNYRSFIISKVPNLEILDGKPLTDEEKEEAAMLARGEDPEIAKQKAREEASIKTQEENRLRQLEEDKQARQRLLEEKSAQRSEEEKRKEADRLLFLASKNEMDRIEAEKEEERRKEEEEKQRLEEEERAKIQAAEEAERKLKEADSEEVKRQDEEKKAEEKRRQDEEKKKAEDSQKANADAQKKEEEEKRKSQLEAKRKEEEEKLEEERKKKEEVERKKREEQERLAKRANPVEETLQALSRTKFDDDEDDLFKDSRSNLVIQKKFGSMDEPPKKPAPTAASSSRKNLFDEDDLFGSNPFEKTANSFASPKPTNLTGVDDGSLKNLEGKVTSKPAARTTMKVTENDLFGDSPAPKGKPSSTNNVDDLFSMVSDSKPKGTSAGSGTFDFNFDDYISQQQKPKTQQSKGLFD